MNGFFLRGISIYKIGIPMLMVLFFCGFAFSTINSKSEVETFSVGSNVLSDFDATDADLDVFVDDDDDDVCQGWEKRYDSSSSKNDVAQAIAVDPDGNVYVTGTSYRYNRNYATIKYDSSGNELWTVEYNGGGHDEARDIAVDQCGNVYVTGNSDGHENDYVTVKYDSDGNEIWVARYDRAYADNDNLDCSYEDYAVALVADGCQSVYVTGYSYGSTQYDYATIKYDALSGNALWVIRYNGNANSYDMATDIGLDSSGDVVVTGRSKAYNGYYDYATVKYDSDGNQIWAANYNGTGNGNDEAVALAIDGDDNVSITGRSKGYCGYDYATIQYSPEGTKQWVARYNGSSNGDDEAQDIGVDSAGNVFVTGNSYGNENDYATIKYDIDGNQLWVARYDRSSDCYYEDYAIAIAVDNAGNAYVTGYSYGYSSQYDYATIQYDPDGNATWMDRYNGPANKYDKSWDIAVDEIGSVYVTGGSDGYNGYEDYLTIKYVLLCDICLIDGEQYDNGDMDPENICLVCDPSQNLFDWSFNDGMTCDDGINCNGADSCLSGSCAEHSGNPCPDDGIYCNGDEYCVETQTYECVSTGDPCGDDGLYCNGEESCDEDNVQCVSSGDPCGDDGLYCNGEESCDENADACKSSGDPCGDDGLYCNGEESCDENADSCVHSGNPCPDDGLFCNGEETCNDQSNECLHSGDPCGDDGAFCNGEESCNENSDECESSGDPCEDDGQFCNGDEFCDEQDDQCESTGDPCEDDGAFCNGEESCDENADACVSSGDPCGDDGVFCNGDEFCDEQGDQCESTGDPCEDDGQYCNGSESCDENADECVSSGNPCGDDGIFCNGEESCNEDEDSCESSGNPCGDDELYCNGDEYCEEESDECLSTGSPCAGNEDCIEEQDECVQAGVLILFDEYNGSWNYGKLFSNMTANLVSHYGFGYRFMSADDYIAGDMANYSYVIYLGTIYANPISPDFLQDVSDRVRPVFWVNYNLWQIAWEPDYNSDWGFWFKYGVAESDFFSVLYKGQTFTRHEMYEEYNSVEVNDPARAEVKAWLVSEADPDVQEPYIVEGDGLWYCADNPFAWLVDADRYVVFSDQLGEFLGAKSVFGKRAMVRFEDNAPGVSDPKKLLDIGNELQAMDIPFALGLIPVFIDPTGEYYSQPTQFHLSDDPDFVDALIELQSMGATILLHGYSHQYDGVTGDDWEFWLEDVNTPVPGDSEAWVQARIDAALAECHANGIYPDIWETPHYSASQIDYDTFYANFSKGYERTRVFNNFDSTPGAYIQRDNKMLDQLDEFPLIKGLGNRTLQQIRSREFLSAGVVDHSAEDDYISHENSGFQTDAKGSKDDTTDEADAYTLQYVTFGVPKTVYGNAWIPENMGYLDPGVFMPEDMLAISEKYSVLTDPVASFFYHHDYEMDLLFETIEGMSLQGYEFVSAQELLDSMIYY